MPVSALGYMTGVRFLARSMPGYIRNHLVLQNSSPFLYSTSSLQSAAADGSWGISLEACCAQVFIVFFRFH